MLGSPWWRSNPDLVARRRGPARKKDDAEDARICCLLALDRHTTLRQLIPHGAITAELHAIAAMTSGPPAITSGCSTGCAPTCRSNTPSSIAQHRIKKPDLPELLSAFVTHVE
jgi:hypothetical protein